MLMTKKTTKKTKSKGNNTRKFKLNPSEIKYNRCEKKNCPNSLEKDKKAYEDEYKIKCPNVYTTSTRKEYWKCGNDLYNKSKYKKTFEKNNECTLKYCAKERIARTNSLAYQPETKKEKKLYKLLRGVLLS